MQKSFVELNDNFINLKELSLIFQKQTRFVPILKEYIEENALNETATFIMPNGNKKQIPIFHYGSKNHVSFDLYIYKKAIPFFVKNNIEKLIELGIERERLYAFLKIIPTITYEEKESQKNNFLRISKLATRYTNNARAATLLTQYIKDTLLTETYVVQNPQTNEKEEKHMFYFAPSPRGRSSVYLLKEARPYFETKHLTHLRKKAKEFENKSEFFSLRGFANFLGNNTVEKELFKFIQEHKDETALIQTENGIEEIKIFDLKKHKTHFYLNVNKKGINSFVKKHKEKLIQMGFNLAEVIAQESDKDKFYNQYITLKTLTQQICASEKEREQLFNQTQSIFKKEELISATKNPFFVVYKDTFFIKKENIPAFLLQYKDLFLKNGAHLKYLEDLTGEKRLVKRTKEMMSIPDFFVKLKSDYYKQNKINAIIKRNLLTETYYPKSNPSTPTPVFVECKSQRQFIYCFQNKEAVSAFLKNHKEELIEIGYKKEMIEHLSGEKTYAAITDEFLYLNDLKKILHTSNKNFKNYILENCLNETYTDCDKDGTLTQKPMFLFLRGKKLCFGDYAISKKALKELILKHAQGLGIKRAVKDAILLDKPVIPKKETDITLTFLFNLLGLDTKKLPFVYEYIKKHLINETISYQEKGQTIQKDIFHFGYTPSGKSTLYLDSTGLIPFLIKNKKHFFKFGLKETKLNQITEQISKNPSFMAEKITSYTEKTRACLKKYSKQKQKEN